LKTDRYLLVTGGAGYIGSHVVRQLGEAGYQVIVYDNCSTGSPQALLNGTLVVGDLADIAYLRTVFEKYSFNAVFHFAGSLIVPESVQFPLDYYENNTRNTLNLLRCCTEFGVDQFIFSSTAAVYGEPATNPVSERAPTVPINPYGRSKLASEWLIRDCGTSSNLRSVILRYFNVSGADVGGRQGLRNLGATHLIRAACNVVLKRMPHVSVFGTDFPTPDGSAIRDYIHVEDLASAHVSALTYLKQGYPSQVLNCGYGKGYSVREVIDCLRRVSERDFAVLDSERRKGDPACVVADVKAIDKVLDWIPKYNNLDMIVATALRWDIDQLLEHSSNDTRQNNLGKLKAQVDRIIKQNLETNLVIY
jgi:UDP-glucose 4-epimerase